MPKEEKPPGCIDDLIGPKLKAEGIKCPCPACTPPGSEPDEPPAEVAPDGVGERDVREDELSDKPPAPHKKIPYDYIRDGVNGND